MERHELSQDNQKGMLAGSIRNMLAAPNVVFSPWHAFDLVYRDGFLCKVSPDHAPAHLRRYTQLFAQDQIYTMTDDAIWSKIMRGTP